MKYYIIFQPSIKSIGGEEMYTRNKIVSARKNNFIPVVIHLNIGSEIYIDELSPYVNNYSNLFRLPPSVYPKWIRNRLIHKILKWIPNYDEGECIVESHEVIDAQWAELLASHIKARHLAYMILESNRISKSEFNYFNFKHIRHELVGMTKQTIPDMFKPYRVLNQGSALNATCSNVLSNIPLNEKFRLPKCDYAIGTIGRTNKEYVLPMIDAVIRFVHHYPKLQFNFLYIGGAQDKESEKAVINKLKGIPNIHFVFTGLIFPISIEMVRQLDVCLASAGSCTTAHNCGVPTISIDGRDYKGIGIFRKTCPYSLFRGKETPPIEIEDLLTQVLIKKEFTKEEATITPDPAFTEHWDFIKKMPEQHNYYDVAQIIYPKKDIFWMIILQYFGNKTYHRITSLLQIIHKIKRH